ncbi:cytochrome c oxidase subunit 4 [Gephyromycinifex aptenodytis]|uniref:cytochrome c oxidase subunit 4 n=1 Tax=Gephyromycinifex aptenodytis TaxID=2716227 RepID=UPI0014482F3B|nr:cytochrome c oxidase subunit 4 [Gephyromycinifex aptenodytis]
MRAAGAIFSSAFFFFTPLGLIYGWLTAWREPVGPVAFVLLGLMGLMVGLYLRATAKRLDTDPADNPRGNISDMAGEYGFFSPHSWWPLPLAIGALLLFLGLAVGWWVFLIGVMVGAVSLVGWTFEYFRGDIGF